MNNEKAVLKAKGKNMSVFIVLSDEGLAVKGGSFLTKGDEKIIEKLNDFNKTVRLHSKAHNFNIGCTHVSRYQLFYYPFQPEK